jgi:hypothetical protein
MTSTYTVVKVYESAKPSTKAVVLWVSRHMPLPVQIIELERKLGGIVVYQMKGAIPSAEDVVEVARQLNASIIVPVLPLSMIARLAELSKQHGFTVVIAKMNSIATTKSAEEAIRLVQEAPEKRVISTYANGTIRVFEFERFERLIEIKLVTEPL